MAVAEVVNWSTETRGNPSPVPFGPDGSSRRRVGLSMQEIMSSIARYRDTLSGTTGTLLLSADDPWLALNEEDALSDNRYWDIHPINEQLRFRALNDAGSVAANWMTVDRTGTAIDNVSINATEFAAGSYLFNIDQTVGASEDGYTLTYDDGTGEISLSPAAGGGMITGAYRFDTSTATGPSSSDIRFDTGAYGTVTEVFVSDTTFDGGDATNFLAALALGDQVYIQATSNADVFSVWEVSGAVTDEGSWFRIPVTEVANGTFPSNNQKLTMALSYTSGVGGGGGLFSEDGNRNIIGGTDAGVALTTGVDNFLAGVDAGKLLEGSNQNIAIGSYALDASVTVFNSIAIGYQALTKNTASNNLAIGRDSGRAVTTGGGNIAIGGGSQGSNTALSYTGSGNVSVGLNSMGGSAITSAIQNTLLGNDGGTLISSGSYNVLLGSNAGTRISTPSGNVFVGAFSGNGATTGDRNIAIGYRSLGHATSSLTGDRNIAIGDEALYSTALTTARDNISIGYQTLTNLTSGWWNTVIGYQAGDKLTAATYSVCIGFQAGPTTDQGSKLFIDKSETDTPLIGGDFTGRVASLGTLDFDADQSVTSGEDNYVLTYDDGTGLISLEAAVGGGGGIGGSITAQQIAYGDTTTDEIAGNATATIDPDGAVGGGSLLTIKDLTVTSQFASRGIDDNSSVETLQLDNNSHKLGTASAFQLLRQGNASFEISCGTAIDVGAGIKMEDGFGGGAMDMSFKAAANAWMFWDESEGDLEISTGAGAKTTALLLDTNQDAIFSGSIKLTQTERLYLDNDADTYIYGNSDDQINFVLGDFGGTYARFISAVAFFFTNEVRIGNTDGVPKLSLYAAAASDAEIEYRDGTVGLAAKTYWDYTAQAFKILVNGTDALSIDTSQKATFTNTVNISSSDDVLEITQTGNNRSIQVNHSGSDRGVYIANGGSSAGLRVELTGTSGEGIYVDDLNGTTPGNLLEVTSNISGRTGQLVNFWQNHASSLAIPLIVRQDADVTGLLIDMNHTGTTGYALDIETIAAGGININTSTTVGVGINVLSSGSFRASNLVTLQQTHPSSGADIINIVQSGLGSSIDIADSSTGFSNPVINIAITGQKPGIKIADTDTGIGQELLELTSNNSSRFSEVAKIHQDHSSSSAIAFSVLQDGSGNAIRSETTHAAGNAGYFYSNVATRTAPLVFIENDNATGSGVALEIQNDQSGPHIELSGTNGEGIKFLSTNQVSTDVNTLDDYHEGVDAITMTAGTGTITINSSYDNLFFTKIGNRVIVEGLIRVSSVSTPTGAWTLVGWPFGFDSGSLGMGAYFPVLLTNLNTLPDGFYAIQGTGGATSAIVKGLDGTTNMDASECTGTTRIYFMGTTHRTLN